jgi:hypothetical protein
MKAFYWAVGLFVGSLAILYYILFNLKPLPGKNVDSVKSGDKGVYEVHFMILPDSTVRDTNYSAFNWDGQMAIRKSQMLRFSGDEHENPLGKQLITWDLVPESDTTKKPDDGLLYRNGKVIQITKMQ